MTNDSSIADCNMIISTDQFNDVEKVNFIMSTCNTWFNGHYKDNDIIHQGFSRLLFLNHCKEDMFHVNPMHFVDVMKLQNPRQVCQYQFRKNDIVWICRSCQKDETCVLCNDCYQSSTHDGHEVYFYHSQAGGCCDCGDPEAWEPKGFCTKHGKIASDPLQNIPKDTYKYGVALVDAIIQNIIDFSAQYVESFKIHSSSYYQEHLSSYSTNIKKNQNQVYVPYHDRKYHAVIHCDDIHTTEEFIQIINSKVPFSLREEMIRKLPQQANFIVKTGYFLDVFDQVESYQSLGFQACIISLELKEKEKIVLAAIGWLFQVAQTGDGMCRLICNALTVERLKCIMEADCWLSKPVVVALHGLFLTLMADQSFKMSVAVAYAKAFPVFASTYGDGVGLNETSLFGLSVQFLNRAAFVSEMVTNHQFLLSLMSSLKAMLAKAVPAPSISDGSSTSFHPILVHRRYNPLLGDLKVVFSTLGTSRRFCATCLDDWLQILRLYQYVHPQSRALIAHVEYESRDWMHAFNLYLGLGSVSDFLVNWFEQEDSLLPAQTYGPFDIPNLERQDTPAAAILATLPDVRLVMSKALRALLQWHEEEFHAPLWSDDYPMCPPSTMSLYSEPINFSFHIFLHRFFSSAIRECCKHQHLSPVLQSLLPDMNISKLNVSKRQQWEM